ncbi:MAG: thiopurine S-methyltransferase [Bacteroidota bacterium]
MDTDFWLNRWKSSDIGFHQGEANPLLVKYFPSLSLAKDDRVFVPMCGKTRDIAWLLSQGHTVVGVELSQLAIEQLFAELCTEPQVSHIGKLSLYQAPNIDVFVGDIFDLSSNVLGSVDAIYDRAALVALPKEMRQRYTEHLLDITFQAPQLLIVWKYDLTQMDGPPFSISADEVRQHYAQNYQPKLVDSIDVPGKLKEVDGAQENVWLLQRSITHQ